jgi:hypothetical protein
VRISEYDCPHPLSHRRLINALHGLVLCVAAFASGCAVPAPATGQGSTQTQSDAVTHGRTGFWTTAEYLAYMRTLSVADHSESKNLHQQANDEYSKQQTSHTRLRLALTLSLLNPPYGDTEKSIKLFKRLLSPDTTKPHEVALPPALESIVHIRLSELNRYQALQDQTTQLKEQLDKANAKIQALTTIERTLEQPIPETKKKTTP